MTTGYPFPGMTGPDFLRFYCVITVIALLLVLVLRERLRATGSDRAAWGLNSLELAYLRGGKDRAAMTVAVGFMAAGAAMIDERKELLIIESDGVVLPPELEPFRSCATGMVWCKDFRAAILPRLEPIHAGLAARGLCPAPNLLTGYRLVAVAILAVPVVIGLVRAYFGTIRHRPVGYLVALLLLTILLGLLLLRYGPLRTHAGDRTVRASTWRHTRAVRAPLTEELALAFALIGPPALAGTPFAGFSKLTASFRAGGGGGGCGGGGGGGGCGGGGGGGCGG
jgi:uncharacterized protein (TIGR04222 family)